MRPLLLEISSFGPYADTQIIDFENNCMRGIFLITAPQAQAKPRFLTL